MTIGFIVDSFPSLSESFIHNQIIGMLNKGHQVYVFTKLVREGEAWGMFKKYDLAGRVILQNIPRISYIGRFKSLCSFLRKSRCDRRRVLKSVNFFKHGRNALLLNLFWKIRPFLGKKIDLFYCHYGPNGNLAAKLKSFGFNIPIVAMFHGYDIRLGIKEGASIYKELFSNAEKILSISEYNRRHLLSFGLNPSKILDHKIGIDIRRFNRDGYQKDTDKIIILSVGRLIRAKGYEMSIEAIHELLQTTNIPLEYNIVGQGVDEDYFKGMVQEFQLDEHVKFLGGISNDKIQQHFFDADIFLHPSFAESMPVVIMEAQMAGLPVIATDVGSVREMVVDSKTGFLVQPHNPFEITEKLKVLLKNKTLRNSMGERGREKILKNHNNDVLIDRLECLFQEILQKNKQQNQFV